MKRSGMWKIAVGFAVFAGLALFILSKGGDIDMGGEKHGAEAMHTEAPAATRPRHLPPHQRPPLPPAKPSSRVYLMLQAA